jgi:hypothetical protein
LVELEFSQTRPKLRLLHPANKLQQFMPLFFRFFMGNFITKCMTYLQIKAYPWGQKLS